MSTVRVTKYHQKSYEVPHLCLISLLSPTLSQYLRHLLCCFSKISMKHTGGENASSYNGTSPSDGVFEYLTLRCIGADISGKITFTQSNPTICSTNNEGKLEEKPVIDKMVWCSLRLENFSQRCCSHPK